MPQNAGSAWSGGPRGAAGVPLSRAALLALVARLLRSSHESLINEPIPERLTDLLAKLDDKRAPDQ